MTSCSWRSTVPSPPSRSTDPRRATPSTGPCARRCPTTLRELDERDDIAAIVLTGADPAFCAGLDLKELAAGGDALRGDRRRRRTAAPQPDAGTGPFPEMATPVIGAINGVAITGGFEVALACDYLVASERARFADTHARVGIMPGWGLTVLLPAAIGVRRAKEMSTTGNFLDAATALAWGLVNHVVPHDELLPFCRQLGHDIASIDPTAVRRMLQTYDEGALRDGAGRLGAGGRGGRRVAGARPRSRRPRGEPAGRRRPRPHPALGVHERAHATT